jgi:hypothetical protein
VRRDDVMGSPAPVIDLESPTMGVSADAAFKSDDRRNAADTTLTEGVIRFMVMNGH